MKTSVEHFIVEHIADRRGIRASEVILDTDVFEAGYMDSLGVFNMLMALEDEFEIRFAEEDLMDPTINTIRGLAGVIASKSSQDA